MAATSSLPVHQRRSVCRDPSTVQNRPETRPSSQPTSRQSDACKLLFFVCFRLCPIMSGLRSHLRDKRLQRHVKCVQNLQNGPNSRIFRVSKKFGPVESGDLASSAGSRVFNQLLDAGRRAAAAATAPRKETRRDGRFEVCLLALKL